ncbi:MAG: hypothetical protein GY828_03845, partial [Candidatus Gracilibacteria bacterium]|nr:hypothetical protein [Candidatus Gracilibacteria bacterium]
MKSVSTVDDIKYFDCENLEKLPALLQNILGVEFIRNNVEGLDIFGMKSLEAKKHEKKFHPLSSYWKDLLQAIDNGKKNKKLVLNEKTVFLIDLYFKLISAKDVLNLNDIINRIQVKGKFLSACFELDVVCYYLDLDMEVEVIPEGNTKTPDLLVSTKKGKVFVEAKLLSDTKKEEIPNWQLLVKQIDKILVKHKKSFVIHIEALERLKDVDFDEIKFLVEQYCIYGNNLNSYSTKNNCAIIHVYRLCDWEYRFIDKINLPEISELQEYMMNTQKTKKGQEYFNIRTIAITQFDRIDISKSVRRNLERAKKQLSEE